MGFQERKLKKKMYETKEFVTPDFVKIPINHSDDVKIHDAVSEVLTDFTI